MVTRRAGLSGQIRVNSALKPKDFIQEVFANPVLRQANEDALLLEAEYLQANTPIGATGELKASWDVLPPTKSAVGLSLESAIVNEAENALFRGAGRGPGKSPPIEPIRRWAALRLGDPALAYAVARKIAREGTNRWQSGTNWIGLRNDGSVIPGGRVDTMQMRIENFIQQALR